MVRGNGSSTPLTAYRIWRGSGPVLTVEQALFPSYLSKCSKTSFNVKMLVIGFVEVWATKKRLVECSRIIRDIEDGYRLLFRSLRSAYWVPCLSLFSSRFGKSCWTPGAVVRSQTCRRPPPSSLSNAMRTAVPRQLSVSPVFFAHKQKTIDFLESRSLCEGWQG